MKFLLIVLDMYEAYNEDLPGDRHINTVIEKLDPVTERHPRRLHVSPNPTIIVRELITVLYEMAIQLDDVIIL